MVRIRQSYRTVTPWRRAGSDFSAEDQKPRRETHARGLATNQIDAVWNRVVRLVTAVPPKLQRARSRGRARPEIRDPPAGQVEHGNACGVMRRRFEEDRHAPAGWIRKNSEASRAGSNARRGRRDAHRGARDLPDRSGKQREIGQMCLVRGDRSRSLVELPVVHEPGLRPRETEMAIRLDLALRARAAPDVTLVVATFEELEVRDRGAETQGVVLVGPEEQLGGLRVVELSGWEFRGQVVPNDRRVVVKRTVQGAIDVHPHRRAIERRRDMVPLADGNGGLADQGDVGARAVALGAGDLPCREPEVETQADRSLAARLGRDQLTSGARREDPRRERDGSHAASRAEIAPEVAADTVELDGVTGIGGSRPAGESQECDSQDLDRDAASPFVHAASLEYSTQLPHAPEYPRARAV